MLNLENISEQTDYIHVNQGGKWYRAATICSSLFAVSNHDKFVTRHCEKINYTLIPQKTGRPSLYVNEAGVYQMLLKAKSPKALEMQNWICKIVLPALRLNNYYVSPGISEAELGCLSRGLGEFVKSVYRNDLEDFFQIVPIQKEPTPSQGEEDFVEGEMRWIRDKSRCLELGYTEIFLSNNRLANLRKQLATNKKLKTRKIERKKFFLCCENLDKEINSCLEKEFERWREKRLFVSTDCKEELKTFDFDTNCKKIDYELLD